jgi:hypothetical protein
LYFLFQQAVKDKVYVGRTSNRYELMKVNKFIERAESTLMDLRLLCWKAKGFHTLYSQDPKCNADTVMNKYIKMNSIKTAKLYQPILNIGYVANNFSDSLLTHWEPVDSAFYDITLLRKNIDSNKVQSGSFNYIAIGIVNRRTDPLIYCNQVNSYYDFDYSMKFFSTAEFVDSCHNANANIFAKYTYQGYWWQRLGCRMIHIPFNKYLDTKPYTPIYGRVLGYKIQEILATDSVFNQENWKWRSSQYCDLTNKVVYKGWVNADVKFLPGDGKILLLSEVVHNETTPDCQLLRTKFVIGKTSKVIGDSLNITFTIANNSSSNIYRLPIIINESNNLDFSAKSLSGSELYDCFDDSPTGISFITDTIRANSVTEIGQATIHKNQMAKFEVSMLSVANDSSLCSVSEQFLFNYIKQAENSENETNQLSDIQVIPNPATDNISLEFSCPENSNAELRITDALGNIVIDLQENHINQGQNQIKVDVSTLKSGNYYIYLKTEFGTINQMFVIAR